MLDISAAFNAINHFILLERLSHWFGFRDTVLASYLPSRTFSEAFPVSYGVTQGSVLGPLLFLLYAILLPLSHNVQASDINHHLFVDSTQLYISFKPENFNASMSALSNAFISYPTGCLQTCRF